MADATILSWINVEVDRALNRVRESIAGANGDGDLLACPEHLHQVSGALRMVGLSGACRFCEAIEDSIAGMSGSRPSQASVEVISRAVVALRDFVDDVSRGEVDVPLRLFPAYRDLAALQGRHDASEEELFFPDLARDVPVHPVARVFADKLSAFVQEQRGQFQRGLLAALRREQGGIDDMRLALDAMHRVADVPDLRPLWWTARAMVDGLENPPDEQWSADARAACNRIDFVLRDLAAGTWAPNEALLREVLYLVARTACESERARQVSSLYQLEVLLPQAAAAAAEPCDPERTVVLPAAEPDLCLARARIEVQLNAVTQLIDDLSESMDRLRSRLGEIEAEKRRLDELARRSGRQAAA